MTAWATRRRVLGLALGIAVWCFLPASAAVASLPIPFAYTVCIAGGKLVSGGHSFAPREWRAATPISVFEGKTVRIVGMLSPVGFSADTVEVLAEDCRPALQKAEALCNPCMTTFPDVLPPMPPWPPKN